MFDIRLINQMLDLQKQLDALTRPHLLEQPFAPLPPPPPPAPPPAPQINPELPTAIEALFLATSVILAATADRKSDPAGWLREQREKMQEMTVPAAPGDNKVRERPLLGAQLDVLFGNAIALVR